MTLLISHRFASGKSDSSDPTLVQPSNWNDGHDMSTAAGKLVGSDTTGPTTVQELPGAFDANGNFALTAAAGYFLGAKGVTGDRPVAGVASGMERFNTTTTKKEFYDGTGWQNIATEAYVTAAIAATGGVPTTTIITATGSSTIVIGAGVKFAKIRFVGAGGGAGGCGATAGPAGAAGGDTTVDGVVAKGGAAGAGNTTGTPIAGFGGPGGTGGTGTASLRIPGWSGGNDSDSAVGKGMGGASGMGMPGAPRSVGAAGVASNGISAPTNTGGGGGPASSQGTTSPGTAGGGGEYCEIWRGPGTYNYTLGAGGAGGVGTGGGAATGGAGADALIVIESYLA